MPYLELGRALTWALPLLWRGIGVVFACAGGYRGRRASGIVCSLATGCGAAW